MRRPHRFPGPAPLALLAACLLTGAAAAAGAQGSVPSSSAPHHKAGPPAAGGAAPCYGKPYANGSEDPLTLHKVSPADCRVLHTIDQSLRSSIAKLQKSHGEGLLALDQKLDALDRQLAGLSDRVSPQGREAIADLRAIIGNQRQLANPQQDETEPTDNQGAAGKQRQATAARATPPVQQAASAASAPLALPQPALVIALFALGLAGLAVAIEYINREKAKGLAGRLGLLDRNAPQDLARLRQDFQDLVDRCAQHLHNDLDAAVGKLRADQDRAVAGLASRLSRLEPGQQSLDEDPRRGPARGSVAMDAQDARNPGAGEPAPFRPAANGFVGPVAELQAQIPPTSRAMQYDNIRGLLGTYNSPNLPEYRVFRDPGSGDVRVLPEIESTAYREHLFPFEPLFILEGAAHGPVSLRQQPRLEDTGSGYRVLAKGRLQVG